MSDGINWTDNRIVAAIIIGIAIFAGLLVHGANQRYELVAPAGDSHIMLLDRKTGQIWMKYQQPNAGPTEWERIDPMDSK